MGKRLPMFYSAMLLTGVNLLLRLASTIFQVFLSGRIGAAGVGLVQLVSSVGMLSATAAGAGIRTASMYLTAEELGRKHHHNISHVLSCCFTYSIVCSSTVSIAVLLFAPQISSQWIGYAETQTALRELAVFLPVNCLCGVMTGYFTAAGRIGTLAAVEVAEQFVSMAVTASLLIFWAGTDAGRACQAVVLGSGIGSCLTLSLLVILRLREHVPPGGKIPVASRLLQAAVPLAFADDAKVGINTLENLMVPKRLALYSAAADPLASFGQVCGMVFPVMMFPAAILFGLCELLIPELARCNGSGSQKRIRYLAGKSLHIAMIFGCAWGGLLLLIAPDLCVLLYGNSQAGLQLQRYALLVPMLYCDAVTDAMVKGLGQQKLCAYCNILTALLDVSFLYLLLPQWGMNGYFLSFLITHLLNFLLSIFLLYRIVGPLLPLKTALLCILATVVGILPGFLAPTWLSASVFLPVFFSVLTLMKVVSKEDVHWLQGLLRSKKRPQRDKPLRSHLSSIKLRGSGSVPESEESMPGQSTW